MLFIYSRPPYKTVQLFSQILLKEGLRGTDIYKSNQIACNRAKRSEWL